MKPGMNAGRLVALDTASGAWAVVGSDWNHDVPAFLTDGVEAVERARSVLADPGRVVTDAPTGLPFAPASLRAFALWEAHMINGARGMVAAFAPPALRAVAAGFERLTGTPLPALRPKPNYYRDPQFSMGNHRSVLADGDTVRWPSLARVVDFELEIGVVLARPVRDGTPEEGLAAIGG